MNEQLLVSMKLQDTIPHPVGGDRSMSAPDMSVDSPAVRLIIERAHAGGVWDLLVDLHVHNATRNRHYLLFHITMSKKKKTPDVPSSSLASPDGKLVIAFATQAKFEIWLGKHHVEHGGVWIRFFKAASGHSSITYSQALDVALCYGWIDGPIRKGDDVSWLHKFTPRGKRSVWSQVNKAHIDRLTRDGLMKPAGHAAVELAKADGRWDAAYASSSTFKESADFLEALKKSKKASQFYDTLTKANRYAIYYRIHNAKKPETKARKIAEFIAMLERGETLH